MNGHTPGPWSLIEYRGHTFSDGSVDHGGFRVDAEGVEQLCYVWNLSKRIPLNGKQPDGPEFGSAQGAANARLIAAAPRLLSALEQAVTSMQDSGYPNSHVAVREARTAIAEATGEQP
jgi:hypothetical protein